jgi:predicted GNAT family N-acyltransferase
MQIKIVDGVSTKELRRAVLRPSWPVGSSMHGDENPDAVHFAAVEDDGSIIGCCLILPRSYPNRPAEAGAWQLRGMATTPARQGQGIGAAIIAAAMAEAKRRAGRLVWCDARTTAVAFYRAHGFAAEGAEFIHPESGIPHFRMWRTI